MAMCITCVVTIQACIFISFVPYTAKILQRYYDYCQCMNLKFKLAELS